MQQIISFVRKGHDMLVKILDYARDPFLLIIRLYWGYQFFLAGKGKLENLERTAGFFAELQIPMPKFNALLAASTECFGGLLLIFGLASRLVSIPLAFTMVVAYITAHREGVDALFSDPSKFFEQSPFLFLYASVIVLTCGPGRLSLDTIIYKFFLAKENQKTSGKS